MLLVAPARAVGKTRTQRRMRIPARCVKGKRHENPRFSNKNQEMAKKYLENNQQESQDPII